MEERFKWKNTIAIRLMGDESEIASEQMDEMFDTLDQTSTTRTAFLAVMERAHTNTKKLLKSQPEDVKRIAELEARLLEAQNEVGRHLIDLDFKNGEIMQLKHDLYNVKVENVNLLEQSGMAVEEIKTKLPKEDQIVVTFIAYELAVLKLCAERLTAKFKKEIEPEMVIKEVLFSYFREESELNIPYCITYADRQRLKKQLAE